VNQPKRMVVVGTGTGVGKTHVSCALLHALSADGQEAVGLKPVETGVDRDGEAETDQRRLTRATKVFHVKRDATMFHVKQSLYEFGHPVSPHLAARQEGVRIDLGSIRAWVDKMAAPITIVETAGGLFTPLGRGVTNLDLVRAMGPAVVLLVAPDRLGVLHELTATLGFAHANGARIDGVVLSHPLTSDASTGTNAYELRDLNLAAPWVTFPWGPLDDSSTFAAAQEVLRRAWPV
jgi:dethiobiotin synthetase